MKNKIEFPNIYRNRLLDERAVRFYAVYLTAVSEGGVSLPLASAITQFVIVGEQTKTFESLEDALPKKYDD